MNSLIILLGLGIVSIIFLIIAQKKDRKLEVLSFISTLIATLIGVLLAVTLSNMEVNKREKEDTIKLLKSANSIINGTYKYTEGLETYIAKLEQDTINYNDSLLLSLKDSNPIPYPDLMEKIVTSELVSKKLSEFSQSQIYNGLINLRKSSHYSSISSYKGLLKDLSLMLELEIEYQNGDLKLEELSNKYNHNSVFSLGKDSVSNKNEIRIEKE